MSSADDGQTTMPLGSQSTLLGADREDLEVIAEADKPQTKQELGIGWIFKKLNADGLAKKVDTVYDARHGKKYAKWQIVPAARDQARTMLEERATLPCGHRLVINNDPRDAPVGDFACPNEDCNWRYTRAEIDEQLAKNGGLR